MISVTLIGAGNVAQHLYKAFSVSQKVRVHQWFNRNLKRIECHKNDVQITDNLSELKGADIFIISVSDDAIVDVSKKLLFSDKLTLHTSGSVNMHHLNKKNHRGVFYPLQTFSKDKAVNFKTIPLCLETENEKDAPTLKLIANAISEHYLPLGPSDKVPKDKIAKAYFAKAKLANVFIRYIYIR